jgi:UDP-N-acetylglucosamine--N-acetylmuramyl-(pentapeptide) pyrophosphoryl-undecaprenol N-acetylglucosamine transferase
VIHLCGPGKVDEAYANKPGYSQIDYAKETLPHLFAVSDIVISRSGANSVCELLALKKPHILIPLPLSMSRGDQIHNARFFEKLGASVVLDEEKLNPESLIVAIDEVMNKHDALVAKMTEINMQSATLPLLTLIKETAPI